jgi:hypothetical protein
MARRVGTAFCAHACTPKSIVKSECFAVHSRGHDDPVPTLRSVLDGKVSAYGSCLNADQVNRNRNIETIKQGCTSTD